MIFPLVAPFREQNKQLFEYSNVSQFANFNKYSN
jgi:hypothetical protein